MTGTADDARRRGLVGLLLAVGVSALGTRMTFLALPWFVLTTTGSPTATGAIAAAELTPYVLVQALGGPVVDRLGAWRAAWATDLGAAAAFAAVPVLHAAGGLRLPVLAVVVATGGLLRGGGDTARLVLLPGVAAAGTTPIARAAGLFDGVQRSASLVGAPLAGVLIGLTSAVNVLALDAASFAVSAVIAFALVPLNAQPRVATAPVRYLVSLREGFVYLRGDRLMLGLAAMVLVTNTIDQAGGAVLFPLWAKEIAHSSVALGLMGGCFGIGPVVGNVLLTWLGPRLPRRRSYAVGFLVSGAPRYLTVALASSISPVLAVSVLAGLGAGGLNPILGAVEYDRIPRELHARVLGASGAASWAGVAVGSLLGGALAQGLGLRAALVVAAGAYLAVTLPPFVFPVWREMDAAPREPAGKLPGQR